MWESLLDAIKAAFNWCLEQILGFGNYIISLVIDLLPTDANGSVSGSWQTIQSAILVANAWAPIDFAIGLIPVFIAFVLGFLATKILIKLIP
jgi:hypothetical protein